MSTIKKCYSELFEILVANKDKKVSTIMSQLEELMTAQVRDKAHYEDEHGLWVFCYYHKQYELTSQVEYGSKANTVTGLNTMCKIGTNQWTKQQRDFKSAQADLLKQVMEGTLQQEDINAELEKLEEARKAIKPLWQTLEEMAYEEAEKRASEK